MTADMNPEVVRVQPAPDYTLHLWFDNDEEGIFDMKSRLDRGPVFRALRDPALFNTVHERYSGTTTPTSVPTPSISTV